MNRVRPGMGSTAPHLALGAAHEDVHGFWESIDEDSTHGER